MQVVTVIKLDGQDSYLVDRFRMLEGMTGIMDRDESDPERKAFRRIHGGAGSLEDFQTAFGAALAAADRMAQEAESLPCPFPEIPGRKSSVEADWRDGLRAQPRRIRDEVEALASRIEEECGIKFFEDASNPSDAALNIWSCHFSHAAVR